MKILNKIKELFDINNQRGVVLPIILMAIGGLSLIGAAAIGVSTGEIGIANNDRNYKVALNMAEAGVADAADGIQANRDLLPRPLGAINSASYSFNIALGNTGRYSVSVSLPVVTTTAADILIGASTAVVNDTTGLNVGDVVVIGDTTTHIMTRIGVINRTTKTLTLMDNKNNPYYFAQTLPTGTFIARNRLQVTSTGYAGIGLVGQYSTVGGWRTVSAVNSTPNPTLSTAGALRSIATLQGDYSLQEIALFNQFQANVNQGGNKFLGPIFVTNSLDVSPYTKGDYSGPIFAPTTVISGGNIQFNNAPYYPSTAPNANYPKVIGVSPTAASRVNLDTILATAASNAACYQIQCSNASATQQIYYLNGYEMDVYLSPTVTNNNPLVDITAAAPNGVIPTGGTYTVDVTVNILPYNTNPTQHYEFTYYTGSVTTSGQYLPVGNGTDATRLSSSNVTLLSNNSGGATLSGTTIDIPNGTTGGPIVLRLTLTNPAGVDGGYLVIADNSINNPASNTKYDSTMIGTAKPFSGERQGNTTVLADGGANSHTHFSPQIQTTAPTRQFIGKYRTGDTTTATSSTWVNGSGDNGAVLYQGKTVTTSNMAIGEQSEYLTTYYIHTNGIGNCNDHDITITSKTRVTYLGTSNRCGGETRQLFEYETIWNHTSTNPYNNNSTQPDDGDLKLTSSVHKGYYEWVSGKDLNENKIMVATVLMGDREFLSVFNHAAKPEYHSAIVNANISSIRMIGWANPPIRYNSGTSTMEVWPVAFPTVTWLPTNSNSTNWDWGDLSGTYSSFKLTSQDGFDYSGFSIPNGNIVAYQDGNDLVLPDMSQVPGTPITTLPRTGTGNVGVYRWTSVGTWPGTWSKKYDVSMPSNPIMNPLLLPTTIITATISGPSFTSFQIKRGSANLFFDAANGIPFNIKSLQIETKGAGANITIGTAANPATVFAGSFKLESEDCGGLVNFNFTGKMVSKSVQFENNVKYNMDTTISTAATCLSPAIQSFIYLKKEGWKEVR